MFAVHCGSSGGDVAQQGTETKGAMAVMLVLVTVAPTARHATKQPRALRRTPRRLNNNNS